MFDMCALDFWGFILLDYLDLDSVYYIYYIGLALVHTINVTFPLLSIPSVPHIPNTLSQGASGATASQLTGSGFATQQSLDFFALTET